MQEGERGWIGRKGAQVGKYARQDKGVCELLKSCVCRLCGPGVTVQSDWGRGGRVGREDEMDRKQAYGEGQEMLMEVDDEDAANYSRCAVPTRPAASSERTKILRQQGVLHVIHSRPVRPHASRLSSHGSGGLSTGVDAECTTADRFSEDVGVPRMAVQHDDGLVSAT